MKQLVNSGNWPAVYARIRSDSPDYMIGPSLSVLHGAIVNSAWHVIEELLRMCPLLASVSYRPGNTTNAGGLPPIHMAMSCMVPSPADSKVFEGYKRAIRAMAVNYPNALLQQDEDGAISAV